MFDTYGSFLAAPARYWVIHCHGFLVRVHVWKHPALQKKRHVKAVFFLNYNNRRLHRSCSSLKHYSVIFFPIVLWIRWSFVFKVIDKLSTRILWTIPPTFMKNDKQEIMKFLLVWRDIDASISLIPATNNFFYRIYLSLLFRFNESQAIACIFLSF